MRTMWRTVLAASLVAGLFVGAWSLAEAGAVLREAGGMADGVNDAGMRPVVGSASDTTGTGAIALAVTLPRIPNPPSNAVIGG